MGFLRLPSVACLLLAGLLSGCASTPESDGTAPAEPALLDPAPGPMASSDHFHDAWQGADRLVVLDAEAAVDGTGLFSGTAETFRPEPGSVVPLGTARVEVAVEWTPGPADVYGDVELLVKTAADTDFSSVGAVESGGVLTLASTNGQNDLPHQRLSGWAFQVYFHGRDGDSYVNLQSMPVRVRAEAVRGLDIPPFPVHPDHWQNRTEVPILRAAGSTVLTLDAGEVGVEGRLLAFAPDDGQTVLPGTQEVVVTLRNDGPTPLALGLSFHGADTFDYTPVEASALAESSWEFRIPVRPEQADGPYARQSLWSFRVEVQEPVEGGPFSGSYSLSAVILRGPI